MPSHGLNLIFTPGPIEPNKKVSHEVPGMKILGLFVGLTPRQLRELLCRGGFRLHKWLNNRPEVMETIPERERASSVLDLDLDKERLPVERTLGLRWDMQKDMFIFSAVLKD
ncbi:hypothetical protein ACROYT_G035161 [Oculina patagonica]